VARHLVSWRLTPRRSLRRDSFDGQMMHVGAFTRMLECYCAHIAGSIEIQDCVFVEVLGLGEVAFLKRDVLGVGVCEVLNLHDW
jgi:hypothetical protein